MPDERPCLLELPFFTADSGSLSFIQEPSIPFLIKRLYWLYNLKEGAVRGQHAHINSDRILICVRGKVRIKLTTANGKSSTFDLTSPAMALYYPRNYWMELECISEAEVMVAVSCLYEEDKVIKEYAEFVKQAK